MSGKNSDPVKDLLVSVGMKQKHIRFLYWIIVIVIVWVFFGFVLGDFL